ncbi:AarF/ABC1/UbiB kinase family protein [Arthrobacter sp.]|uniref:ABC1 kinase family protein n=1 Tax=Arthrobacter sp. TaxID=1667 RepID=UPI0026E0749C|nr:AarF/ABC1/UbiB kinase family protein [Arthrobacter sp.]MDO5752064.1 AarF/ABC1/UbiB kinase family protein [Arthrobacter sp.]
MNTHLERLAQVAEILGRHGLGSLVAATGVDRWRVAQAVGSKPQITNPHRIRLALEELGPVFIKLGQMLSTRPDLLPPGYLTELSKLQDGAPPVSADAVRAVILQELGAAPEQLFATFDDAPLASASIGQAHTATLFDGTEVVVKVRRPGVVARINEDLEILQNLATYANRTWPVAADFNFSGIATDFAATLRAELDYLQEGRNAERFEENFAADPGIHIPRIFWETTSSRVLTIERIRGIKVDDVEALVEAGIDTLELADRAARAAAKMIFEDGFFHADPHPGNLFVEASGTIGLIDFGMVGEVRAPLREQLAKLLQALTSNNPDRISSALLHLSTAPPTADRAALRHDAAVFIQMYQDKKLGELEIGPLVVQLLAILRDHRLQLPRELALLAKMLLMTEGMGARLNPEFSLGNVLKPYARRLALERFEPRNLAQSFSRLGLTVAEIGLDLPEKLERLAARMDDGVEVRLRTAELEPLVARAEQIGNRLVAGMVAAAFIRGIGDVATADSEGLTKWGKPLLAGAVGAVGALSTYLAWTGRHRRGTGRR